MYGLAGQAGGKSLECPDLMSTSTSEEDADAANDPSKGLLGINGGTSETGDEGRCHAKRFLRGGTSSCRDASAAPRAGQRRSGVHHCTTYCEEACRRQPPERDANGVHHPKERTTAQCRMPKTISWSHSNGKHACGTSTDSQCTDMQQA